MGKDNYSRLKAWNVENFMSIKSGRAEFDETGIINFKGYNDSGKSAMLLALRVLMTNWDAQKHTSFIFDDEDYFRILAEFDDGVMILRDKYLNGQSLYEMYKDGVCIFSTKVNGVLTRVSEVPEPIATYLGLVTFDKTCLNMRATWEKRLGVETSGSENYRMFNIVLCSEEIASASAMLNNDRNKLGTDINAKSMELDIKRKDYTPGLTKELVDGMQNLDDEITFREARSKALASIGVLTENLQGIEILPHVPSLDTEQLRHLESIQANISKLQDIEIWPELRQLPTDQLIMLENLRGMCSEYMGIGVAPELQKIDQTRLDNARYIATLMTQVQDYDVLPEVPSLEAERLDSLEKLMTLFQDYSELDKQVYELDGRFKNLEVERDSLQDEVVALGGHTITCPSCGASFLGV